MNPSEHKNPPLNPDDLRARFTEAAGRHGFEHEEIFPGIPAFSRKEEGPVVLLSSGMHGDEPAGPLSALAFLEQGPPTGFHWLLTPLLNPSGIALGTRENKDGLDLNRDYHQPKSPEIQAHTRWLARQSTPGLFLSLHEDYDGSGFYVYEIQTGGQPSIHEALFAQVTPHLPLEPGPVIDGRESSGPGWFFKDELPDIAEFVREEGGWPEALALSQKGCPLSLTFETPTFAAPLGIRVQAHLAAIGAAIDEFGKF